MRLSYITALLAAFAATGSADRMTVQQTCGCAWCGSCNAYQATFFTDYGAYGVNANKGCRKTKVPGMTEFCVDWDKGRAHFRFKGQKDKRCLKMTSKVPSACNADHCYKSEWNPTKCTW